MKFEAVTIKDIAKQLGLSTSTVSRALRDSYEISAETKKLVIECAEQLNYTPNPIALSLKEKRSRSIAVLVCEIANSFFSQVINGVDAVAYDKGYNVIISQSHESLERENSDLQFLASRSIDGLIISMSSETANIEHLKKLHERGLPIVLIDRVSDEIDTHVVKVENFQSAYNGTLHLIENGYRNIACLSPSAYLSISNERIAGYRQALSDKGIDFDEKLVQYCQRGGLDLPEVMQAMKTLMEHHNKPDAVFSLSDKLTLGAMQFIQINNIQVPDQLGIIGFSNSNVSQLFNPALTIIQQPAYEMGKAATELLLKTIESKRPVDFEKRILPAELIVRNSTIKKTVSAARPKKPVVL